MRYVNAGLESKEEMKNHLENIGDLYSGSDQIDRLYYDESFIYDGESPFRAINAVCDSNSIEFFWNKFSELYRRVEWQELAIDGPEVLCWVRNFEGAWLPDPLMVSVVRRPQGDSYCYMYGSVVFDLVRPVKPEETWEGSYKYNNK